jgi:hypothetical protein
MNKMQEAAAKRLESIKQTWRSNNDDSAVLEAIINTGRSGSGYTDDLLGKLAKLFDNNGKLSFSQMQAIRNRLSAQSQVACEQPATESQDTDEQPVKVKRKYTKRVSL